MSDFRGTQKKGGGEAQQFIRINVKTYKNDNREKEEGKWGGGVRKGTRNEKVPQKCK